jgi:hypothetical protein
MTNYDPQTPKARPRLTTDGRPYVPPVNVAVTPEAPPIQQNNPLQSNPITHNSEKRSRNPWIRAGIISVVLLGAFAAFVIVNSSSSQRKIDVTFKVALKTDMTCEEISGSAYSDYENGLAEIYDNSENLLGSGQMDAGVDIGGECVFTSEFEIKGSEDGVYRAAAGSPERGLINFLEDDVVKDHLRIDLWCCSEYSDGGADIPACSGKENGGDSLGGSSDGC